MATDDSGTSQPLGEQRQLTAVEQDMASTVQQPQDEDGDDAAANELEVNELKARTMYRMVEDVFAHGARKKLLFLTNPQTELICSSKDSMRRLIDAFDIREPKLVINLLRSQGTIRDLNGMCEFDSHAKPGQYCGNGRVRNQLPWASYEEALHAEKALDNFMSGCLLPLATENNAIVITEMIDGECFLGTAFNRMLRMQAKKWGETPPLTILAIGSDVHSFYRNANLESNWRELKKKSKTWKQRERTCFRQIVLENNGREGTWWEGSHCDLNRDINNYIIVDGVIPGKNRFADKAPANSLKTELVRYLTDDLGLPAIAIKTGCTARMDLQGSRKSSSSLAYAIDCMESGQQLLFLDLRTRPLPAQPPADRAALIEAARALYMATCDEVQAKSGGAAEIMDVMAAAYWRDVLRGDAAGSAQRELTFEPICDALRRLRTRSHGGERHGSRGHSFVGFPTATESQIKEVAWWLAKRFYTDAFEVYKVSPDGQEQAASWGNKAKGEPFEVGGAEHFDYYMRVICADRVNALSIFLEALFKGDNFHACNVSDVQGARRLVSSLIKIDRLPAETPREGLELLIQAWDEHDITVYLGRRYAIVSSLLYLLYLAIGVVTVAMTVLHVQAASPAPSGAGDDGTKCNATAAADDRLDGVPARTTYSNVIFCLSLVGSFVLTLAGFTNPTQRYHTLQSATASIESVIWRYRTRVGEFARSAARPLAPEHALRDALQAWRDGLIANSDLEQTAFKRIYRPSVFQHHQRTCPKGRIDAAKTRHERQSSLAAEVGDLEARLQGMEAEARNRRAPNQPARVGPNIDGGGGNTDTYQSPSSEAIVAEIKGVESQLTKLKNEQAEFYSLITHSQMDDHQSPMKPEPYIELRLRPTVLSYRTQIPGVARWRLVLQCILFACTGASAALAHFELAVYVGIISAAATAVASWVAFQSLDARLARYTATVRALEGQLSWWFSLSDVDKASVVNITRLVENCEQIITAERLAWQVQRQHDASELAEGRGEKGAADPDSGAGVGATDGPATRRTRSSNKISPT